MATDKEKTAIGLGLGIGAALIAIGISQARKGSEMPPEEGDNPTLKIDVYDSQGNKVPSNSPLAIYEGETYTIEFTVTNRSTRGGQPVAVDLQLNTEAAIGTIQLLAPTGKVDTYGPGGTIITTYSFTVPAGSYGMTGAIYADILAPTGVVIASAKEDLNVTADIIYDATVIIG